MMNQKYQILGFLAQHSRRERLAQGIPLHVYIDCFAQAWSLGGVGWGWDKRGRVAFAFMVLPIKSSAFSSHPYNQLKPIQSIKQKDPEAILFIAGFVERGHTEAFRAELCAAMRKFPVGGLAYINSRKQRKVTVRHFKSSSIERCLRRDDAKRRLANMENDCRYALDGLAGFSANDVMPHVAHGNSEAGILGKCLSLHSLNADFSLTSIGSATNAWSNCITWMQIAFDTSEGAQGQVDSAASAGCAIGWGLLSESSERDDKQNVLDLPVEAFNEGSNFKLIIWSGNPDALEALKRQKIEAIGKEPTDV